MTEEATGERQMLKDTLAGINRLVIKFHYLNYTRRPIELGDPRRYVDVPSPLSYKKLFGPMRLEIPQALTEIKGEGLKIVSGFSHFENRERYNHYRARFLFLREIPRGEPDTERLEKAFQGLVDATSWLTTVSRTSDGALRVYLKTPRDKGVPATPEDKDEEAASAET